jgi:hypothetical protein
MHQAALEAGRSVKLRIHVTGLDAMCRMIDNGLGIGVMPQRAFELLQAGIGQPVGSVALNDAWAHREIRLVARDFSTLPVAARTLVTCIIRTAGGRIAAKHNPHLPTKDKTRHGTHALRQDLGRTRRPHRRRRHRRSSTSTATWCTKSPARRPSRACAKPAASSGASARW